MQNVEDNSDNPDGMIARLIAGLLILGLMLGVVVPAHAQTSARLVASGLETRSFPNVTFNLEAYDEQGQFLDGLTAANLTLREDGQPLTPIQMQLVEPGLQLTVALNLDPSLERLVGEVSQFELIRQALLAWVGAYQGDAPDEFSLAVNNGLQIVRSPDAAEWNSGLGKFAPDLKTQRSDLMALTHAVGLASDPTQDVRTKRAVLYITPPMSGSETGLPDLAGRADQMDVRIFVWVVTTEEQPEPEVALLQALADRTGGRLALVRSAETFPDLESWLAPLRKQYRVLYESGLREGGTHLLEIQLQQAGQTVAQAEPLTFDLNIAPPNPIFISPPAEVQRAWSEATREQPSVLQPQTLDLQILVEFTDGLSRPIETTRLFLDGVLISENTTEPFDRFSLDLKGFEESGPHTLRVEAQDNLGLIGSSIESPLVVMVQPEPQKLFLGGISPTGLIAIGAVLVAGLVLAAVLVGENRLRSRRGGSKARSRDPLTQPVAIQQESPRRGTAVREPGSAPRPKDSGSAGARLVRLNEHELPVAGEMIPLNHVELTLGSDSAQAMMTIRDASVDRLHARILRSEEGGFRLVDQDSVAGTWINFAPVSGAGCILRHGDLVHIGRIMYRFELANPPARREPVITLLEEN